MMKGGVAVAALVRVGRAGSGRDGGTDAERLPRGLAWRVPPAVRSWSPGDMGGPGACLGLRVSIPQERAGEGLAPAPGSAVVFLALGILPSSSSSSSSSSSWPHARQLALGPGWLLTAAGGSVRGKGAQPRGGILALPSLGTCPPPSKVTRVALVPITPRVPELPRSC